MGGVGPALEPKVLGHKTSEVPLPGPGCAPVMHILGPVVHRERTAPGSPGDEMVCLGIGAVEGCGPPMMECVRAGGNPEAKMLIL